jgi:hypothetical protein
MSTNPPTNDPCHYEKRDNKDAKIKREGIHGEQAAINAHAAVGREVRVCRKKCQSRKSSGG